MKFELTSETKMWCERTLYRIRALVDVGAVAAGELGGWVESAANLSQSGTAWIYDDALVSDDALVGDNARVHGDARVYGAARVYGDALVGDYARVYDNARVYGAALVCGDARVCGNARVCGAAQVRDVATKTPVHISGWTYPVTITDTLITIGCQHHTASEWATFSDADIARMDGCAARRFWAAHRDTILAIAHQHQRT